MHNLSLNSPYLLNYIIPNVYIQWQIVIFRLQINLLFVQFSANHLRSG